MTARSKIESVGELKLLFNILENIHSQVTALQTKLRQGRGIEAIADSVNILDALFRCMIETKQSMEDLEKKVDLPVLSNDNRV